MSTGPHCSYFRLTEDQKRSLMRHIKRIARLYDDHFYDPIGLSRVRRIGGPNPSFAQTQNGIFLAFSYGVPDYLWTPWGAWSFATAEPFQVDISGFMSKFTAQEYLPETYTRDGALVGPIYAILAIEGEKLSYPEAMEMENFLDPITAKAEWKRLYQLAD